MKNYSRHDDRRRMSYKEKKEFEALSSDIKKLEQQCKDIENLLCSGTLSVEELTEKSRLLPQLKKEP